MIVLCIIANANNPDLNLSREELDYLKRKSRITVLILGCWIIVMILLFGDYRIVSFLALGVIYNALSLLIAIIIERGKCIL